jgi:enoyl-CoA hydratase/carnithine racemase
VSSPTEIRLTKEAGVATITLNRPDKLNAFTATMLTEMVAAFDETDADDDVRAVIVTGEGRAFCAGADLSAGAGTFDYHGTGDDPGAKPRTADPAVGSSVHRDGGGILTLRIFASLKPVIAAINGPAVGIGATMTLPMDIRLASDTARIGFVFSRRGLVPEAASSWFLPRVVGISTALDWVFSGRLLDANEAADGGLVRSVHPAGDLLDAAHAVARSFTESTSAVSVATSRQLLWRMLGADHPMKAHKIDSRLIAELGAGADVAEGVTSFLAKRPPEFPNRPSRDLPATFPWWDEPRFE